MATISEQTARIRAMAAQAKKVAAEQAAALQKVRDELANAGTSTPELDAAVDELAGTIQSQDDLNPDEPAVDPVTEPTTGEAGTDETARS